MSRFLRIMAVLAALSVVAFLLFLTSVFSVISTLVSGSARGLQASSEPHLTVLNISGPILSMSDYAGSLERILSDETCKALLVRVDSPGGAVGTSQEIFHSLKRIREKGIPVIVSQGNLAASGGYYVSLAGEKIFASPGTLTGSIGVIFQFPEAHELLKKLGLSMNTVKSGRLKDAGSAFRKPTDPEIAYLQGIIGDTYEQFLSDILASRPISREKLLPVADGRVLTGRQARAEGLIDTLGGYLEARRYALKRAGLPEDAETVEEPPQRSWMENVFESRLGPFAELGEKAKSVLPLLQEGAYFLWR